MRSPIRPQVIGFCLFTIWAFGTVYIFFQMRQEAMERFRSEAKSKKIGFTEGWILYPDNFSRDFLFRTMRDEYFEGLSDGRVVLTWIDPTRDEEIILWIHGGPRAIGNQTLIGEPLDRLGMENRISYDIKPLDEDQTVKGRLHFEVDPWQIQAPTVTFLLSSVNVLLLITILMIWLNRINQRYEASQSELEEKKKELIQQEQLALAGRLSAGLLHDLKKPVIHIREECIDSENPDHFHHIREQSDLFLAMLRDSGLEGFAKSRPSDPEFCDVVELMERSLRLVEYERDDVQVSLKVEGEIPLVWALPTRLMQVFSNLVLNAYQAMKGRGRLEVRIEELNDDAGGGVKIILEDDGPGIPDENLAHLFEPFFTTSREGSGMGLYITRTILSELGGEIHVSNRPEGGAHFEISLPEGKD
ncbi:MAG: hypothetical protein KC978_00585 [Candidatus Omnitrophica bacterium]|nr:hypothetical protein [Candidatus Omnitrophota bacterium]